MPPGESFKPPGDSFKLPGSDELSLDSMSLVLYAPYQVMGTKSM